MRKKFATLTTVLSVVILFGLLSFLVQLIYFKENSLETFQYIARHSSVNDLLNNPLFWTSCVGMSIKMLVDICVTAPLLWLGFTAFRIPMPFQVTLRSAAFAQLAFFLQYITETIFLLTVPYPRAIETLSLFSIDFFAYQSSRSYHPSLSYAFQTLSLFEILFAVAAAGFVRYHLRSEISFLKSLKIVSITYGIALITWLIFVTLLML